ncbi:MAG: 50S ribosomal protein L17 [Chlamydiae bacterium]|nr:50S ribosomal protein L17 [Chlamydiota bacterium]
MRHRNQKSRLNRTTSHRLAMMRNMAKSFILSQKIETTVPKAKALREVIEPLITLAKEDNLTNRRRALQLLSIRFNKLDSKDKRKAKEGDFSSYNGDRLVMNELFDKLGPKFKERPGGYTRIIRTTNGRVGDSAECCIIECVE